MEEMTNLVFGGVLAGFSIVVFAVKLVMAVVGIVVWLVSRWVLRRALTKAGVITDSIIYVPVLGSLHVISQLSSGGRLSFFSFNVAPIVPKVYVVLSVISTLFFPFILKLVVGVLGWFCNGVVYTRIWDVSEGRTNGESSCWGLASAVFRIVIVVKCLLMAFSPNGVKAKIEGGDLR